MLPLLVKALRRLSKGWLAWAGSSQQMSFVWTIDCSKNQEITHAIRFPASVEKKLE